MRECFGRRVGKASRLLAFAMVILACTLPVDADTLPASHAVAPDGLFQALLLVSVADVPSTSTVLVFGPEANGDALVFDTPPSEVNATDFTAQWLWLDDRSETGAYGVRRFMLLAILLGAVLRFLTSATFLRWAVDVFGPDGWD
jgi:hypothetical protein